jgi:hypothetical protein
VGGCFCEFPLALSILTSGSSNTLAPAISASVAGVEKEGLPGTGSTTGGVRLTVTTVGSVCESGFDGFFLSVDCAPEGGTATICAKIKQITIRTVSREKPFRC